MAVVAFTSRNPMGRRFSGAYRRPDMRGLGAEHLRTLGALGSAPSQDTLNALAASGADSGLMNALAVAGVTDEQLLGVLGAPWADSTDLNTLLANLMNQLGGAGAVPGASTMTPDTLAQVVNIATPFGAFDLSVDSAWQGINALFESTRASLTALAQQFPSDPDVLDHIQQFNSLVLQWADYYMQAEGVAPSPLPLASSPALAGMGIGQAVVIVGIVAAVAALLGSLYVINQWIQAKKASVTVGGQTAAAGAKNQAALLSTYNSLIGQANAVAKSNPSAANQLLAQANALIKQLPGVGVPGTVVPPTDWGAWFQANAVWIALGIGAVFILPPLIKKL